MLEEVELEPEPELFHPPGAHSADTDRKEYNSKRSKENYKVRKIEYDTTGNRTFQLEGLTKLFLRHDILKV